ncbi:MAG TPA: ribbon-helix-helix protein, CopG family [Candidatus Limnocylindrales bacterium]
MGKVLISIPEQLLAEIDREASARGSSRSAFLQEAARRELGTPSAGRVRAALERGRQALRGVGAFEAADAIRASRDRLDAADRRR